MNSTLNENQVFDHIAQLFCILAKSNSESKLAASEDLLNYLSLFTYNDIFRIEVSMRRIILLYYNINWRTVNFDDFITPEMSYAQRRAVTIFASFNPYGFLRQQATETLRNYEETLPYIIIRLNDWVPQVRESALSAFKYRLDRVASDELIASLPFAYKLKNCLRTSHLNCLTQLTKAFNAPEKEYALIQELEGQNVRLRRICTEIICNKTNLNINLALKRLRLEVEPSIRMIIFNKLIEIGHNIDDFIEIGLMDKFPALRLKALVFL